MDKHTAKKVRIINKTMDTLRKGSKGVSGISLNEIAKELSIPLEDLTSFFLTVEDVFLGEQKRLNIKLEKYIDTRLSKAKVPNDAKDLLDGLIDKFVDILPEHADLVLSVSFYLPSCLKERRRAKAYYRKIFKAIIKKGWPGKIESVLDRQTELVLLSFYGFYDYCSMVSISDRKALAGDFRNMLNLHLQDRLFF
ncbi:MAG: hypothetical protein ABGX42_05805 [Gammaproteobacteria bacterium]